MKKFFALISSLSISSLGLLVPLNIAQASDICDGGECEVVFEKTEEMESWQVPDGVVEIYFEVRGAQGGADGGLGGIVSGSLVNLPSELQIVVGGAGVRASKTSGGFNGGGKSGGEHGNPGSGGGASDIRLGTELADRIVVAGGGGGFGGAAGGEGGAGGDEIATAGTDAQGEGGGGGTQEQGGVGGKSNKSEVDGESGQLGIGGRGGWGSYSAGGGGGGGGYFGGGGGGADSDFCCEDGGGGGGGSSFADTSHTKNVTFEPGANALDGSVVLRYELPPNIIDFSAQQVSPSAARVSIEFDKDVTGVETSDFVLSGCQTMELSGEGQAYSLDIMDCEEEVVLTIQPNSIGQHLNAPKTERSIELTLDQLPPAISISHPEISNSDSFQVRVETDDTGVFDLDAIASVDCEIMATEQEKALTIDASGCAEGPVLINFESEFLTDLIGNESLSKSKSLEVLIDTVAPVIEVGDTKLRDLKVENEWLVETTTSITISESSLDFSDFVFDGPNQCSTDFEQSDRAISLQTIRCPEGQIQWLLPSNSITDIAGNSAPSEDLLIELLVPAAKVDPPKQPEEETLEESEPENTEQPEQPEQPEKPESDNPEQTEPENPEQNQPDEREQPESEIDEPVDSINPDTPAQQPSPETENPSQEEIESENSIEVEQPNDASIEQPNEQPNESEQQAPTTEAEQPSSEAEQESDFFEEAGKEVSESDSDVSGNIPDSENPSLEEPRLDMESQTTIPVSQPREFSEIEENDEPNIWAILLAGLLVLGLIFGVVFLTKNNSSRAIE